MYGKVAIAIDNEDLGALWSALEPVLNLHPVDLSTDWTSPDNIYMCFYWDFVCWEGPEIQALEERLGAMRHSMVKVDEDGKVFSDISISDDRGTDEEFYNLLSCHTDIYFWLEHDETGPLAKAADYVPVSRDRMVRLFREYIERECENDEADASRIYERLKDLELSDEEIEALDLGFVFLE